MEIKKTGRDRGQQILLDSAGAAKKTVGGGIILVKREK
jgi:hypothetical protein